MPRIRALAWGAGGIGALLALVAAVLTVAAPAAPPGGAPWSQVIAGAVLAVPGALIAAGRPRIAVGWLILAVAVLLTGNALGRAYAWYGLAHDQAFPGAEWGVWFAERFSALVMPVGGLALALLPDGTLPSRRWRPAAWTCTASATALIAIYCLVEASGEPPFSRLANPIGVLPPGLNDILGAAAGPLLSLCLLLAALAAAVRVRRSRAPERTRITGLLLAVALYAVWLTFGGVLPGWIGEFVDALAACLFATVLTSAVLRRRLREVEVVVHRAVVYTLLTAAVLAVYGTAVVMAENLGQTLTPYDAGAVTAAIAAMAAAPLRLRLQRAVDRLLYGDRSDPYTAVRRLTARTHSPADGLDGVLPEIAGAVAVALRVPWAEATASTHAASVGTRPTGHRALAVPLTHGDSRMAEAAASTHVAAVGIRPADHHELAVPLTHGDSRIGVLRVGAGPGRPFSSADRALLRDLAIHAGLAVHAALLGEALRASRERIVAAREEERRRLRRDLHDGLGPVLAGLAVQLDALSGMVADDPKTAATHLIRLRDEARSAVEEIRRVSRDLRPTALDELGLPGALERVADSLSLTTDLTTPGDLPTLPAAVEVAAYRIGAEALTNIARHAGTHHATLEITADTCLTLSVADHGHGFGHARPGVGLTSMRERADELGGTLELVSSASGTAVTARLPLPKATP